jgi:TatA/E family protein of Tat protein translocase
MTPLFAIIDAPIIAVIIGIAVILFGAERIPKLARSMGQAKREFEAASAKQQEPPPQQSIPPPPSSTPGTGEPPSTPASS